MTRRPRDWADANQDLLSYLASWLRDYQGPPDVMIGLERGGDPSECQLGWLTADGPSAFGNLTVWETGDVAVELYDRDTAEAVLLSRGRVNGWSELAPFVSRFVSVCAGTPGSGTSGHPPSSIEGVRPGQIDSLRRRLRH